MDPSNYYPTAPANNDNKSPNKRQINSRAILPFAQQTAAAAAQQQQGQLPTAANGYPSQYMTSSNNLMYSGLGSNVANTLNYGTATGNTTAQTGYQSTFQPLGNLPSNTMSGTASVNMNSMMFAAGLGGGLNGGTGAGLGGLANGLAGATGTGNMNFTGQMYPAGFSQLQGGVSTNGMAGSTNSNVNRMAAAYANQAYQAQAQAQAQAQVQAAQQQQQQQQQQQLANVVAALGYDMSSTTPTNQYLQRALLTNPNNSLAQYANLNVKMHNPGEPKTPIKRKSKPSPTSSPAITNANLNLAGSSTTVSPASLMNPVSGVGSLSGLPGLPAAPSVSSMSLPANMMSSIAATGNHASLAQGVVANNNMAQQVSQSANANMMANLQAAAASMNSGMALPGSLVGTPGMAGLAGSSPMVTRGTGSSQANHRFMPYTTPKQQVQPNNYSALANALGAGASPQNPQRPQHPSQQVGYPTPLQQQQAHLQQLYGAASAADLAKSPALSQANVKPSPKIPPKTPTMANPALQATAQQPQAGSLQQLQQGQFQQPQQHSTISMQSAASSPELAASGWNRAAIQQALVSKQAASQAAMANQTQQRTTPQQQARSTTPQQQYQQLLLQQQQQQLQQQQQQLQQLQQARSSTPPNPPRPPTPQQGQQAVAAQPQNSPVRKSSSSSSTFVTPTEVPSRPASPAMYGASQIKHSPSPQPPVIAGTPTPPPGTTTPVTAPATPPRQKQTYMPKTRNVDTYGGIELKYFEKFDLKQPFATLGDLGAIDIRAVTMSLKSGMRLEVANALNILTMVAAHRGMPLILAHCDDLLDVLLDFLEQDFVRSFYEFDDDGTDHSGDGDGKETIVNGGCEKNGLVPQEYTYAELFDLSLDEMKSVIPKLENSSSELWLSRRERCTCLMNLLRNFSFMAENQEYLANHQRFVDVLARTLTVRTKAELADKWEKRKGGGYVNVREMDILDHRKSVLIILSNIVAFMTLRSAEIATALVALVGDFMRSGPETYYAQVAIEVWSKMSVSYDNRIILETLDTQRRRWREQQQEEEEEEEAEGQEAQEAPAVVTVIESHDQADDNFLQIERIWTELATAIRRDYFDPSTGRVIPTIHSTQLAVLEMAIMGLYNIAVLARDERTKARLIRRERGVAMMVLRLCVMLAETGNIGFSNVCRRGVELVRALVAGGDGGRRRSMDMEEAAGVGKNRKKRSRGTAVMVGLINVTSLSEMLMQAMLRGSMDQEIMRELWDLVGVVDAAA